ncbi:hypothetical protein F9802_16575 [Bacillus aerolatus]|uniref:Carbohydrate diacid regulator n=1 Tax=Bacillus aerolatus TaxID=2653354 RepID=A0A6I1FLX5_9BACI|nr:sugar diacid recognition domain-containing protein [Bacillus aerolatus]KAB7704783.1 hypothetical protein F9802_16575 [Bacillus aerolatus]
MKFFEQIAQSIVEQTSTVLDVSMSITDANGIIIGCSSVERIGSYHVVTKEVTKAGRSIIFTKEKVADRVNVLPGVATPIRFQQQIIGVLGIIGEPDEVGRYVEFVRNHVEMMLRESFRTESFYIQMKTTELFIQHLIHFKEWDNEGTLHNYCEMSGFHFDQPRLCILIDIPSLHKPKEEENKPVRISQYDLFQMISNFFEDHSEDIISPINPKQWIVLKYMEGYDADKLRHQCERAVKGLKNFLQNNKIPGKVSIAYGKSHEGLAGVSRSYHQALQTLTTGKQSKAEACIYAFDDWSILLNTLIKEINPAFSETLNDYIEKLLSQPNASVLIETFLVYCEQGLNVSQAARRLYVHRNTLLYRLNQLNQIFTIDTQSFEQCMLLYLALKQNKKVEQWAQMI